MTLKNEILNHIDNGNFDQLLNLIQKILQGRNQEHTKDVNWLGVCIKLQNEIYSRNFDLEKSIKIVTLFETIHNNIIKLDQHHENLDQKSKNYIIEMSKRSIFALRCRLIADFGVNEAIDQLSYKSIENWFFSNLNHTLEEAISLTRELQDKIKNNRSLDKPDLELLKSIREIKNNINVLESIPQEFTSDGIKTWISSKKLLI
jgi:hypothetical protein